MAQKGFYQKGSKKNLMRNGAKLNGAKVAVGWTNTSLETYPDTDTQTYQVAFWQEFGTKRIPPTLFMSDAIEEFERSKKSDRKKLAKAVQRGSLNKAKALDTLGALMQGDIQQSIRNHELIDTGLLIQSVTWEVRK